MNIGLAIDKKNGVESEVVGTGRSGTTSKGFNDYEYRIEQNIYSTSGEYDIKKATNEWDGWGTALKPSYESIIIAQKPYSIEIYLLIEILDILNEVVEKCQLNLNANIVEKISKLNQAKQSVEENIVLNNAESKMFTSEDLLEVMDILQSMLMENINLNTELLCLNFLAEICDQMSKYTTETKINLITELKILKLLVVQDILENTIEENKTKQLGMKQNALTVEEFLKEEKLKLNYINILSVQENVILQEKESNLHPSLNQIIVARKPFKGSCVDNVLKYGVGGLNIDECRVGNETTKTIRSGNSGANGIYGKDDRKFVRENPAGRFPANVILTYEQIDFDEVCGGLPNTKSGKNGIRQSDGFSKNVYRKGMEIRKGENNGEYGDSGSAARYFYCAKASKKDRDEGLDIYYKVEISKEMLKCEENMVQVQLLKKVISDLGIANLNISEYGENIMVIFPKECKSTILIEINKITELKIYNLLTHLLTKDCIVGAKLEMESGGSLVENVENLNQLQNTTKENQELVHGASLVVLRILSKIKEEENWKSCNNFHCTVKPTSLMQYLIRLVTPKNGIVLDPFMGSGSTGKAVAFENKERQANYKFIGIEKEKEYCDIAEARIKFANEIK